MGIYKVVHREYHQLTISRIQEFDTSDQKAWDSFKSSAEDYGVDVSSFPDKAPKDAQIWFSLISEIPPEEYGEMEEDCWTLRKGGYDTSIDLEDEKGNPVST